MDNRPSQMLEAEQTIRVLNSKLEQFVADASVWKINVEATVDLPSLTISVVARSGERGVRKTMTIDHVKYNLEDATNFANGLAVEMLVEVLGPTIKAELTPKLVKAMKNLVQISGKDSFA